jgi:spermidine synthase
MDTQTYIETDDRLGGYICWKNAEIISTKKTHRGTLLEFVRRPHYGIACYMNGSIQSCELDETLYHANLVQPCFSNEDIFTQHNICIFGGGEGATAREALRHSTTKHVFMCEWDIDVLRSFQSEFPQWARGAWDDPRLAIRVDDAFSIIHEIDESKFTIVIVDLFEPEDQSYVAWHTFFSHAHRILKYNGMIGIYAGMYMPWEHGKSQEIIINHLKSIGFRNVNMTKVFIPSFLGEACFVFAKK